MPIPVTCACGREYLLKDEFAGRRVRCVVCGQAVEVPGLAAGAAPWGAEAPMRAIPVDDGIPVLKEVGPAAGPPSLPTAVAASDASLAPASRTPKVVLWCALGVLAVAGLSAGAWMMLGGRSGTPPEKAATDPSAGPKSTTLLKIKFTPGSYGLTETSRSTSNITFQGQTKAGTENMTIEGDVNVSEPDASREQTVRFICRRVQMDTTAPNQSMKFDSRQPPDGDEGILADMLRPMVGWEGVLVGRDGQWTRVEGVTDLMMRMQRAAPPAARPLLSKFGEKMDAFLQDMLVGHWGELIPERPVAVGDTWKSQMKLDTVPILGAMRLDADCVLHGLDESPTGPVAKIGVRITTTLADRVMDLKDLAPFPIKARIVRMSIDQTGTAWFDTGIGLSTRITLDAQVKGTMEIESPDGEKVPLKMDVRMVYENRLVRQEAADKPEPAMKAK
jgi:hypothetical protein